VELSKKKNAQSCAPRRKCSLESLPQEGTKELNLSDFHRIRLGVGAKQKDFTWGNALQFTNLAGTIGISEYQTEGERPMGPPCASSQIILAAQGLGGITQKIKPIPRSFITPLIHTFRVALGRYGRIKRCTGDGKLNSQKKGRGRKGSLLKEWQGMKEAKTHVVYSDQGLSRSLEDRESNKTASRLWDGALEGSREKPMMDRERKTPKDR